MDITTDGFNKEKGEWIDALEAVILHRGDEATISLLTALEERAVEKGVLHHPLPYSPYRNTISVEQQPKYPGDIQMEERISSILRWNALVMVMRANAVYGDLGGHIASYASSAEIFEIGFNHFFRGGPKSDIVYYQAHSAPGVYARAFLDGRLSEAQLNNYRQEVGGNGLSSYPHPWLMPDFWQVPSASMGLGPVSAIHNARFMRYLDARGLEETSSRHVWGVFGDGEMDEPESTSALSLAANEGLDNLTFIVNCNLQRLDGPVRGNGQIVQELEATFRGAGWNVIKVLWSSDWDTLFAKDTNHVLLKRFSETVDGKFQTLGAKDGSYNLEHFFDGDPEVAKLVSHLSDDDIHALRRGGHDLKKLYAAFAAAKTHRGQPTVILAKTKKGFGLGDAGESRMISHQAKKLNIASLLNFRDRFGLLLSNEDVEQLKFYRPDDDSPELTYLRERRQELGGLIPARRQTSDSVPVPELKTYAGFALEADGKEMSSTTAFVRLFSSLLRDKHIGPRIVPIVADEARTFGMANLFRQIGIYASGGQKYEPEDAASMLFYRESSDGQLMEEGITEAGAMGAWTAAATSYSHHDLPMLPIYIFYSMFGFQRVGDMIWAAGDQRARGFLIGATSGRTTLGGEGLQHQDGSSQLVASTVPNCRSYDPCYAFEAAIIFDYGTRRMMEQNVDEFYYLTVTNENYPHPSCLKGIEQQVIKGMYLLANNTPKGTAKVNGTIRLLGSGAILREVEAAGVLLAKDWNISAEIFSVTSFSELERDARNVERHNRIHPEIMPKTSHVAKLLPGNAPIVAATDYVCAYPQLISPHIDARYLIVGTDGFGRSDTRSKLRMHFEIDRHQIVLAALDALTRESTLPRKVLSEAIEKYAITFAKNDPWTV